MEELEELEVGLVFELGLESLPRSKKSKVSSAQDPGKNHGLILENLAWEMTLCCFAFRLVPFHVLSCLHGEAEDLESWPSLIQSSAAVIKCFVPSLQSRLSIG